MADAPGYLSRMSAIDKAIRSGISEWWDLEQVAAHLNVKPAHVGRLVRLHNLPHADLGGVRRYPREAVEAWTAAFISWGEPRPRKRRSDAGARIEIGRIGRSSYGAGARAASTRLKPGSATREGADAR